MLILVVPILVLGLFAASIILFLFKRWKSALMFALLGGLNNIYFEVIPLNLFKLANDECNFRVAVYNIDCLGNGKKEVGWQAPYVH